MTSFIRKKRIKDVFLFITTMKMNALRIAIAQLNATVGDLEGNARLILRDIERARGFGVDVVSFPELVLTGYPPEDLLLKPKFIQDNIAALKSLAKEAHGIAVIIGFVDKKEKRLYNAAAVIENGVIKAVYRKMLLPNYGVFDEKRYFTPGEKPLVVKLAGVSCGINICEDIWFQEGPTMLEAARGAKVILTINASPYYRGKYKEREAVIVGQAKRNRVAVSYANMVGGQDELVFDGQGIVVDASGKILGRAEAFKEDLLIVDVPVSTGKSTARESLARRIVQPLDETQEVYQALVLGLGDYVKKNGFSKVVIGLSGGIDSALVATLAVDALGKVNVIGVFMPSRYSSLESEEDAAQLARNLGIKFLSVSIEQIYKMYLMVLDPHFAGSTKDITEENIQARIRGNILMAFSNKFGWLVLTTGNKSEMSTGYATLYGDMAGGLAVIKDVPKMLVYALSRYRNSVAPVIPERILTKAPTAELRPNQKDSDSLPPYETLDAILKEYVEEDREGNRIVASGFEKETVSKVMRLVDRSEYKRRQSPPGIKITPKAFGRDRRMPITNWYK